jgi:hypothetical protein
MLAEKPMNGAEVAQALNIPGKRGHYWLHYLQSFGVLEITSQGYVPSDVVHTAILDTYNRESWGHLVIDEQEKDACVHSLPQLISEPGSLWSIQGLEEPKNYVDRMRSSPERAREFTRMLFEVHQNLATQVAELLDLRGVERMMDLGGNSGVIAIALLRTYPVLTSTVVDNGSLWITFPQRKISHPLQGLNGHSWIPCTTQISVSLHSMSSNHNWLRRVLMFRMNTRF